MTDNAVDTTARDLTDKALAGINGRSLVPAAEVTDWLLDIRRELDRKEKPT